MLGACNIFKSIDDKTITTNIQAKLFSDPVLKMRDIRVDSRNGTVTLAGTVDTDLEKAAVERIATQEEGVKNVVNMLSVASEAAATASESTQKGERAPPQLAPPPAAPAQTASGKPRHAQHTLAANGEDKASAELRAYTNSVTPDAAANPAPMPPPAPAAAPAAAPPPQWPHRRRLLRRPLPSRRSMLRFPRAQS